MKDSRFSRWVATACLVCLILCVTLAPWVGGQVVSTSPAPLQTQLFPPGASGVQASPFCVTGVGTTATLTITQPAQPGHVNYCTGFEITSSGSTAATTVGVTLASGGTTIANYDYSTNAIASTQGDTPLIVEFSTPIAGLGPGQTMVLTLPGLGAGTTAVAATLHGYSQ